MEQTITSRDNPAVKEYTLLLTSRKARHEQRLFVTEGEKLTREALLGGCACKRLFFTARAWRAYETRYAKTDAQICLVNESVAAKLSGTQSTQGVFGVFSMLDNDAQPVKIENSGAYLILSSLQDPGNLGTILRTAAAFGIDGVFLNEDCPDLYSLKVLRACMGGVFKLPVQRVDNLLDVVSRMKAEGVFVWAAALHKKAQMAGRTELSNGCAVAIGNEGAGLGERLIQACDGVLALPMRQNSESLNAAMAAGIFMWEMAKHRLLE